MSSAPVATSTEPSSGSPGRERSAERIVALLVLAAAGIAAGLATAAWCWALVSNRDRGLDTSDESYYLLSALHPGAGVARQSNFGFYLHAMLRLGGGTIGGLRLMGVLLLMSCTAIAAVTLAWAVGRPGRARWLVAGGLWMALSAAALTYYTLWLATPSYNHLSLCAGLVVVSALFRLATRESSPDTKRSPRRLDAACLMLGWSLVVLLDVKATSAVALLGLSVLFLMVLTNRLASARGLVSLAVGGCAGLLTTVIVAGSPVGTVRAVSRYAEMLGVLDSHSAAEVWETEFLRTTALAWLCWFLFALVAIGAVWRLVQSFHIRVAAMAGAMIVVSLLLWSERVRGGPLPFANNGWWWFRMSAWTLLFTSALAPRRARVLVIGPLLTLSAPLVASGSNNGFIRQTSFLAALYAFGVLAQAVVVYRERQQDPLVTVSPAIFVFVVGIASMLAIGDATREPYRLSGPIGQQDTRVSLTGLGAVRVNDDLADSVRSIADLADTIPREARDCVVELSGDWPVSLLALDARSATTPWLAGGFGGSSAAYEFLAGHAPCLEGEVLLIESPDSPNRIELPPMLRGRTKKEIGVVRVGGSTDHVVLSLLEPRDE